MSTITDNMETREHYQYHTLTFTKHTERALRKNQASKDMDKMVEHLNTRNQEVNGWTVHPGETEETDSPVDGMKVQTTYSLVVTYSRDFEGDTEVFDRIVRKAATRAPQAQGNRWTLTHVDYEEYEPAAAKTEGESDDSEEIGYAPVVIPDDFEDYFSHLFGLENQVLRVRNAIESAIKSNWYHRFNVVLYGPPGCGKSELALSLKKALGDEAVWSLDGTAITQAGITKELGDREVLPRIVVVEEIEKGGEEHLRMFLSMLDTRGEVRKTTARGSIERETKMLCIATVNDMKLFKGMLKKALASRFPERIKHNRPSREVLTQILHREIDRVSGDRAWASAALDYCDQRNIYDPRRVIAICMGGRNMLLTGDYQRILDETTDEEAYDAE